MTARWFLISLWLLSAAWQVVWPSAALGRETAPDPTTVLVHGLQAEEMGVDSAGLLWAVEQDRLTFLSEQGEVVAGLDLPADRRALAADSRWGVALLDTHGRRLSVLSPSGAPVLQQNLPDESAHLAWIDADHVALGLTRAAQGVEIRPLRGETKPLRLWELTPIRQQDGVVFLHSVVLESDPGRRLLYALDSLHGRLRIFTFEGEEKARREVPNPRLPELEAWLSNVRASSEAGSDKSSALSPLYTVLRLAIAPDVCG